MNSSIAIIGGGAAGMMAAATICEKQDGYKVFVIERNTILGQKVLISGGGRCNVTTGLLDVAKVLSSYPRGAKFLRTSMHDFPPQKMIQWIEKHGIPLKTEDDLRVFPVSNSGKDVVGVFEKILKPPCAKILFNSLVKTIKTKGKLFNIQLENGNTLEVEKVILTPGGQAYRHTGSRGDGYALAEMLGHTITDLAPSLSSFMIKQDWVKKLAGVSFQSCAVKLIKKSKYEFVGPIMFTHRGITGPAIFSISSLGAYEILEKSGTADLFLDFLPAIGYEEVREALYNFIDQEPKKYFLKSIATFVPKSMAWELCDLLNIALEKQNSEISRKNINRVVEALKNTRLTIIERTPGDEFVTAGGVKLSEVDSKTMESKICPGLFFAGEILDIDGFTGGFNLQAAWATGRQAGMHI